MRDARISLPRVQALHSKIRDEVQQLIEKCEEQLPATQAIRVVQGVRTWKEQDALYAQGRTKPGNIVTKAKGGSSWHNFKLAVDLAIIEGGKVDWELPLIVIHTFKGAGYEWGGDWKFKDKPHFQKVFGWTLAQARESHKRGEEFLPIV
jgi:peptidoglycan L-alanyl-D-glutamate endopeptidase CwlK